MKLLMTFGGTREPIDSIRYISNISTGATGLFFAKAFLNANYTTTLLASSGIAIPVEIRKSARVESFTTFENLKNLLMFYLSSHHFDIVVHLAAVGDYFVSNILIEGGQKGVQVVKGKISGHRDIYLKLELNPKLLPKLKSFSRNKDIFVVGFKLTDTEDTRQESCQVQRVLNDKNIDALVHNKLSDITGDQHIATVYHKRNFFKRATTKKELSETLLEIFSKKVEENGLVS